MDGYINNTTYNIEINAHYKYKYIKLQNACPIVELEKVLEADCV